MKAVGWVKGWGAAALLGLGLMLTAPLGTEPVYAQQPAPTGQQTEATPAQPSRAKAAPPAEPASEKAEGKPAAAPKKEAAKIAPVEMSINGLAGLVIFFFGVYEMTRGLRSAAHDRIRRALERFTRNRFSSVLTGTAVTTIVDSSSIVTIMTVGLVSAGLLSFANALGIVMGANVGTTISSQLVAFGLTDYFGVVLVAGAVLRFFVHRGKSREWGQALMGLGLVFLGLEQIEAAMGPIKDAAWFTGAMARLENPLLGIALGATITAIIQSSSATMGVVIIMAGQGAISLPVGIAIMMGAELGTCVDTLASTIGQPRAAVRTGVFHFVFNAVSVLALGWFGGTLAAAATAITPGSGAEAVARQIANAHVIFNVAGVLLFLPFIKIAARLLEHLIPDIPGQPAPDAEGQLQPAPSTA